jgi:predicted XRE-type DNA-binding protein
MEPVEATRQTLAGAIAARLEKLRSEGEGQTQAQLAELLGITQSKVSQLLRQDTTRFSIDRLIRVASDLDLVVRVSVTRPYTRHE